MNPVPMKRSGRQVDAFLSTLGSVRETRLTAALAYLAARFPKHFLPLLTNRGGDVSCISVEETEEGDRYDVLVRGGGRPVIVEAKTGYRQDSAQLLRYVKNVRRTYGCRPELVVVDVGAGRSQAMGEEFDRLRSLVAGLRIRTWTEVAKVCRDLIRRKKAFTEDRVAAAIAQDFLAHLEENQMISNERSEIYLRDVSSEATVNLYFRHCIYKCQAQFLRSARNNLYFAPYFTMRATETLRDIALAPIGEGVSYISRIKDVQVVPKSGLLNLMKAWGIEKPTEAVQLIRKDCGPGDVLVMLLGKPQLLFLSPVTKAKLAKVETHKKFTPGAMGSRSCTLEELLAAARI